METLTTFKRLKGDLQLTLIIPGVKTSNTLIVKKNGKEYLITGQGKQVME